eukprot:TRINITY_DN14969_c0_g1_i1.p1 TRINITY_DN14969_c0_g1~~TRINITY_DN14969_c0_g1_i1.p1  ORF type:complete len:294 (+),score=48.75 TRINITY_DN14969_c0_g1_i1:60-941(+)
MLRHRMRASCVTAATLLLSALVNGTDLTAQTIFNETQQLEYINLTWAAHCNPQALANWSCFWCTDPTIQVVGTVHDDETKLYGFVAFSEANQSIIISYRGSTNIANFLTDIDFAQINVNDTNARVHAGFLDAWHGVRSSVLSLVAHARDTTCTHCSIMIVLGHSLGAAVAGLTALELGSANPGWAVHLHTYGMPRTGDKDFVTLLDKHVRRITRMTHQHDMIPHLPPIELDFRHTPTEVWDLSNSSDGKQRYVVCDGSGEDPSCADSVPFWQYSFKDHLTYMGYHNEVCRDDG